MSAPMRISRNGTITDRATGTWIGRVWLSEGGWYSEGLTFRYNPCGTQRAAARGVWEAWRAICLAGK